MSTQASDEQDEQFVGWFKDINESEVISDGGTATNAKLSLKR